MKNTEPSGPVPKLPPRHALRIPPALAVALADARALDNDLARLRDRVIELTHNTPVPSFDLDAWLAA